MSVCSIQKKGKMPTERLYPSFKGEREKPHTYRCALDLPGCLWSQDYGPSLSHFPLIYDKNQIMA